MRAKDTVKGGNRGEIVLACYDYLLLYKYETTVGKEGKLHGDVQSWNLWQTSSNWSREGKLGGLSTLNIVTISLVLSPHLGCAPCCFLPVSFFSFI